MKITVWINSGANAFSGRRETIDVDGELGYSDEEWTSLAEKEKAEAVMEYWSNRGFEFGWSEEEGE